MQLVVGSNWDPSLVDALASIPQVVELMCALPLQPIGTDRPPAKQPTASKPEVEAYVRRVHGSGRKVSFLLNAPSVGGRELLPERRRRILEYVGWIDAIGVDAVAVCSLPLFELVKERFPRLAVQVSHNAGVSSVDQLRAFQNLGAASICVGRCSNPDLPLLRSLARIATVPLELTCLSVCLAGCPRRISHYHLSVTTSLCTEGRVTDRENRHGHIDNVCWCHVYRLGSPEQLLRGCFLRPEDLPIVTRETGINRFKLDTRGLPTPAIVSTAKAFADARYDGDLKHLLNVFHFVGFKNPAAPPPPMDPVETLTGEQAADLIFNVASRYDFDQILKFDNRGLDGYYEEIARKPCAPSCADCDHCKEYAAKAMKWNTKLRDEVILAVQKYRQWLLDR